MLSGLKSYDKLQAMVGKKETKAKSVSIIESKTNALIRAMEQDNFQYFDGDPENARIALNTCYDTIREHAQSLSKRNDRSNVNESFKEVYQRTGNSEGLGNIQTEESSVESNIAESRVYAKNALQNLNAMCRHYNIPEFMTQANMQKGENIDQFAIAFNQRYTDIEKSDELFKAFMQGGNTRTPELSTSEYQNNYDQSPRGPEI